MGDRPALNSPRTQSRSRLSNSQQSQDTTNAQNVLFLVTVDSQRRPAILAQVLGDIIGDTLGGDENQHFGVLSADLVEVLDELVALLEITADLNDLLDIRVGGQLHGTDVDLNGISKEILEKKC